MDAMLDTVANSGQVIVDMDREAGRNKLISCLIYNLILNPLMGVSANPLRRGSWGWNIFCHKNYATAEASSSIMVRICVCCVFC
jgi:hypothetical protein